MVLTGVLQLPEKVFERLPDAVQVYLERFKDASKGKQAAIIFAALVSGRLVWGIGKEQYMRLTKNLPPNVPYTLPIIGNTFEYFSDPHGFLRKVQERYGFPARIFVLGQKQTIVGKNMVREVMMAGDDKLSFSMGVRETFDLLSMLQFRPRPSGGKMTHELVTKHLTPNLKNFTPRVVRMLEGVSNEKLPSTNEPMTVDDTYALLSTMVAKAGASVFVGEKLCENRKLVELFRTMTSEVGEAFGRYALLQLLPSVQKFFIRYLWQYVFNVNRSYKVIIEAIEPEIQERERGMNGEIPGWERPNDILQDLIEDALPRGEERGDMLRYIAQDIVVLVFVSIHTTSHNSNLALWYLALHPEYVDELLDEQKQVFSETSDEDQGTPWTGTAIKKMVKLDSFVRETFRMRGDGADLPHKVISEKDCVLSNGMVVPKGEIIQLNLLEVNTDADVPGGHPEEFRPWRFVAANKNAIKVGADYLPFGMGKHACPGRFFAIQEIKTILAMIVGKYEISTPDDVDMYPRLGGPNNFKPKGRMIFKLRH
ncbi:hypothetical protein BZG36_01483 [Bifiguratus adelaidae]|uniref:Cytochrome P450 n=1 Tax=Bifiguratus adelaidae TaxID=1938954 RepID=A0A261Y4T0_9FUNG|nr:hypothetical protein BZG36_01483 [Bifiguratus adelaidae]